MPPALSARRSSRAGSQSGQRSVSPTCLSSRPWCSEATACIDPALAGREQVPSSSTRVRRRSARGAAAAFRGFTKLPPEVPHCAKYPTDQPTCLARQFFANIHPPKKCVYKRGHRPTNLPGGVRDFWCDLVKARNAGGRRGNEFGREKKGEEVFGGGGEAWEKCRKSRKARSA